VALKFKLLDVPVVIAPTSSSSCWCLGLLAHARAAAVWMVVVTGSSSSRIRHATFFDFFGFKPVIRLYGAGAVTMAMSAPNHRISPRSTS